MEAGQRSRNDVETMLGAKRGRQFTLTFTMCPSLALWLDTWTPPHSAGAQAEPHDCASTISQSAWLRAVPQ